MATFRIAKQVRLRHLTVFGVVLGAAVGLWIGSALAATINCSHVNYLCQGTNGADSITGWKHDQQILGKNGDDSIWAHPGNDIVNGEGGADALSGGEGFDAIYGHSGDDSYWVNGNGHGLFGGVWADGLYGGEGRDFVQGDGGQDEMFGNTGADVLYAEDGNADIVNGNGGQVPYTQPCYVDGYDAFSNCEPH